MEDVKALKSGKYKDLHRKLDETLSQRENQNESEKKIDGFMEEFVTSREEMKLLRKEMKKVAEDVRNSQEMKHLKDSVETCVGYQELFVRDFEKIHEKIQETKAELLGKFYNLEQKLQGGARETENIGTGIKNIEKKLENFGRNLQGNTENGPKFVIFGEKIEKLEHELNVKIDLISKTLFEMKKNFEMEVKSLILESNKAKREKNEKLSAIKETLQNIKETNFKCRNCNSILPKNPRLREDGVTVQCPKCNVQNIVGKLKKGQKWMTMYCNELHFQQFPFDKKHEEEEEKCQVCRKKGKIWDANQCVAKSS